MRPYEDPEDPDKTIWQIRETTHGWASQVQCAGIWDLSDLDISLLKRNPDIFQGEWFEFCKQEIAEKRRIPNQYGMRKSGKQGYKKLLQGSIHYIWKKKIIQKGKSYSTLLN